jgi:formiminotetrahydrofolate cyclodeaminase
MKLTDRTLTDLLAAFRSSDPTPGGGSASALAGAVGASLLVMVASLPKPRTSTEGDLERLAGAGARCADLAARLTALIDRDSDAYNGVMAAYKRPKATEAEKAARSQAIQEALRNATEAPMDVMRACAQAIEQGAVVATFGNPNASSDAQVGLELLRAGLRGARLNAEVNLGSLKDAAYVENVRARIEDLS